MGLYVSVTYSGDWWGEDPITETVHETPGALFRSLSGRDKSRPWEKLGRCTGKVYIDVPGSPCTLCHLTKEEHEYHYPVNPITTRWIEPNGEYPNGAITTDGQHYYQAEARHIGWVFEARNPKPTSRADENVKDTGLRVAWVTVHDAPDTVTRTPHYADIDKKGKNT